MNIFVLNTGRCGSTTFAEACNHIHNYTSAHESRADKVGEKRIEYSNDHIEIDNRLSWFLGRLDEKYGDKAFYVHLKRNREDVASSFEKRYGKGIIKAYSNNILMDLPKYHDSIQVCMDYYHTVNSNIELFLKDKSQKMDFSLENAEQDFEIFWNRIRAEGKLSKALDEWDVQYNESAKFKKTIKRLLPFRSENKLSES